MRTHEYYGNYYISVSPEPVTYWGLGKTQYAIFDRAGKVVKANLKSQEEAVTWLRIARGKGVL